MSDVEIQVDYARVLELCNRMLGVPFPEGASTPELVLATMLVVMQTYHATFPKRDRGFVAAQMKRGTAHFAAEWAAGNIPITFRNEAKEEGDEEGSEVRGEAGEGQALVLPPGGG
jgi:hypothetical protein